MDIVRSFRKPTSLFNGHRPGSVQINTGVANVSRVIFDSCLNMESG
jgi:hypothetical protein